MYLEYRKLSCAIITEISYYKLLLYGHGAIVFFDCEGTTGKEEVSAQQQKVIKRLANLHVILVSKA